MKIKNWDKLNGITYRGRCIVNPIHNADETKYYADIIDISLPQNPKWELVVLVPGFKFKHSDDNTINVILSDSDNISSRVTATKEMIKSIQHFRMLYERLIDELIAIQNKQTLYQSSTNQSGILNNVMSNGNTIDYTKVIGELIDVLQNDTNVSKDLKTALNDLINKD